VNFPKLRVHVLGEPGTTVVTGEGLGPDLRVPVPFVMARRSGAAARFVAVYDPSQAVSRFEGAADSFTVQAGQWSDEISVKAGAIALVRRNGTRLVLAAGQSRWLESSVPAEAEWSADGKTVDLYLKAGGVRVYAPHAEAIRVNGRPVGAARDGDYRRVTVP
jgi:hypothetical protein